MRQLIYEQNKLKNLTVDLTLRKILITEDGFKLFDFSESNHLVIQNDGFSIMLKYLSSAIEFEANF